MFIFSNLIGSFVFDDDYSVVDSIMFKDVEQYNDKKVYEDKLREKHGDLKVPGEAELSSVLLFFKDKKYFPGFLKKNLEITKNSNKNSVQNDILIGQTVNGIREIEKNINSLTKRLREWYSLHNPETSYRIKDHELFVDSILKKSRQQLLKEIGIDESMGADLKEKDILPILLLATQINNFYKLKRHYESYLKDLEKATCPNFMEVAGPIIAAKLLDHAGSLRRLVEMPSSTIQVIGAEKALFRHMRNKRRNPPPRHGLIMQHPLISEAPEKERGKRARALAAKISMAVKVDYFKGEFIGDRLKKELIDRFKIRY